MSLRRGLQVIVGAIRRRVQQQAQTQGHVYGRKNADAAASRSGVPPVVARTWLGRNASLFRSHHQPNLVSSASRFMGQWNVASRFRAPQASGGTRASPPSPLLSLLLGFAGVGFVNARQETTDHNLSLSDADGDDGIDWHRSFDHVHVDFETAVQNIRLVFKAHNGKDKPLEEERDCLPTRIEAYSVAENILAKGTEGVVFAAKCNDTFPVVRPLCLEEEEEEGGDSMTPCSHHDDSTSPEDGHEGGGSKSLEICDDSECTLAIKMMFNYNVGSTPADILTEFHAEQLPLWLAGGEFGSVMSRSAGACSSNARSNSTRHPNIIEMYQAFVGKVTVPNRDQAWAQFDMALPRRMNPSGEGADATLYIVMKRYTSTLRQYLQDHGPLPARSAVVIVAQLLEAVAYLGDRGVVHRDLKTNNILVACKDAGIVPHVVIADFGCALSFGGRNLSQRVSDDDKNHPGNCALQAPEIKKACSQNTLCYHDYLKADVWAVGAIAYEICGQENPFYASCGLQSDSYDEQSLPQLQTQAVGLKFLVQLLLQRDPQERPDAHVAANMLQLFLWQPSMVSLNRLCICQTCKEREIVAWLIKVFLITQLYGSTAVTVDMPLGLPEQTLLCSLLKRVKADSLETAVHLCSRAWQDGVPPWEKMVGTITDYPWEQNTWLRSSHDSIICPV